MLNVEYIPKTEVYHGQRVGHLTDTKHAVSGNVFIVDDDHLRIRHFTYDGAAPGIIVIIR